MADMDAIAWLDKMHKQAEAHGHNPKRCLTDMDEVWCQDCDYTWHPDTVRVMRQCHRAEVEPLQRAVDENPHDELGWPRLAAKLRALGNKAAEDHCLRRIRALRIEPTPTPHGRTGEER